MGNLITVVLENATLLNNYQLIYINSVTIS